MGVEEEVALFGAATLVPADLGPKKYTYNQSGQLETKSREKLPGLRAVFSLAELEDEDFPPLEFFLVEEEDPFGPGFFLDGAIDFFREAFFLADTLGPDKSAAEFSTLREPEEIPEEKYDKNFRILKT